MSVEKDLEQDELIRQNAEHIRRNEEAIRRQTDALEKIRDHYFPRKPLWKRSLGFLLKAVGAVTVAAGIMESADWYWNTRLTDQMAEQSAAVAQRLFTRENDADGAAKFLEKAVELDSGTVKYRISLATVKGLVVLGDLFDIGRPLTPDERRRVDAILTEAVFLQEVAPDEPMPHVLAAQAYAFRGERAAAEKAADRAIALAPESVQPRVTACATRYASGDIAAARRFLAEAERIDPAFPPVAYWRAFFAVSFDNDAKTALSVVDELLCRVPRFALAHGLRGWILMSGPSPDLPAARAAFARAIELDPNMVRSMVLMAESYEKEGDHPLMRLWLDRALRQDPNCMSARIARARLKGKTGDWKAADADLTAALELAPLRADLYRERHRVRTALGDAVGAEDDRKTALALDAENSKGKR